MKYKIGFALCVIGLGGLALTLINGTEQSEDGSAELVAEQKVIPKVHDPVASQKTVEVKKAKELNLGGNERQDNDLKPEENVFASSENEYPIEEEIDNSYSEPQYNEMSQEDLFAVNEASHDQTPTNPDFSLHGRPITLNERQLRNLKEKQLVNLPLDTPRQLLVEGVEKRTSGSVKLKFSMPNHSQVYRAFITVGKRATFGRIVTPEGTFELEVVNGKGWIVDTRKIDDKMPEDGVDYLIPDS